MSDHEKEAMKSLSDLEAGQINDSQAREQLIAIGVDPDHADEMIDVSTGGGDIQEI